MTKPSMREIVYAALNNAYEDSPHEIADINANDEAINLLDYCSELFEEYPDAEVMDVEPLVEAWKESKQ